MNQLYATIKETSKYEYQNEWAAQNGQLPFPVEIVGNPHDYGVRGNGNAYCLCDLELYVFIDDGKKYKL